LVLKVEDKEKEKEELTETMNKLNIEGPSSGNGLPNFRRKPVIIIVVGMAGDSAFIFNMLGWNCFSFVILCFIINEVLEYKPCLCF